MYERLWILISNRLPFSYKLLHVSQYPTSRCVGVTTGRFSSYKHVSLLLRTDKQFLFPHMVTGQIAKLGLKCRRKRQLPTKSYFTSEEILRRFSEHFHFSRLCPFMSILTPPHFIIVRKHHPGSLFFLVDP
jgi:hypothetical protein